MRIKGLCSVLLVVAIFTLVYAVADQSVKEYSSGFYRYTINEDGTACITGYGGYDYELVIPDSLDGIRVTSIGKNAFNCCAISSVYIPNGITNIENNPFSTCEELTSIKVSADHPTLATIDGVLFGKADKRLICYPRAKSGSSYTIQQGIRIIGNNAFYGCDKLTGLALPNSVTTIEDCAFSRCSNLTDIIIPDSVQSIGVNPFIYCGKLVAVSVSRNHPTLSSIEGVLFSKVDKRLVWYPQSKLDAHYVIPQGVQLIGDYAFANCSNLSEVTIPDSVTTLGKYAFLRCSNLSSVTIPNSLVSMGSNPFISCSNLSTIRMSTDHPAFAVIEGVLFSKTDKRLVWYPRGQTKASYTIPQGIQIIGEEAFSYCGSLKSISIPDTVTYIEKAAFQFCQSLTDVVIPDSVIAIGDYAFTCCSGLKSVTISKRITSLGTGVFQTCYNLKEISLPQKLTAIGDYAFYACSSLPSVILPDGVITIGDQAFMGCRGMSSITIPGSVMAIGEGAFLANSYGFTLIVARDSYAAQYAKDYDINYSYTDSFDWLNNE